MASSKGPGTSPFFHFLHVFLGAATCNQKRLRRAACFFCHFFGRSRLWSKTTKKDSALFLVQHRDARAGERWHQHDTSNCTRGAKVVTAVQDLACVRSHRMPGYGVKRGSLLERIPEGF